MKDELMEIEVELCDYEEDKVINGVLHYWLGGAWHEYDKKCLTAMLLAEQEFFQEYVDRNYSSSEH